MAQAQVRMVTRNHRPAHPPAHLSSHREIIPFHRQLAEPGMKTADLGLVILAGTVNSVRNHIAHAIFRPRKRFAKIRSSLIVFATFNKAPDTNNVSERALRSSVVFRKPTDGFRFQWCVQLIAAVRSVIDTGRQNGLSALHAIRATVDGRPIFMPAKRHRSEQLLRFIPSRFLGI